MKKIISILVSVLASAVLFADGVNIKKITASSTLVEKGKASDFYGAANIHDGKTNSWVEGVSGDGIGESITFEFASPLENARCIYVKNGYGDLKYFFDNNRVKDISVTLNDEYTVKACLKDTYELQTVTLYKSKNYSKPISKMTVTIDSVYKGTKYSDTCIAEIMFPEDSATDAFKTDSYMTELTLAYYRDIEKALDVRVGEDGFVEYLKEWDELDKAMEGPDGSPYWVTWLDKYPDNIFVVSYGAPFAVIPSEWTSIRDPFYARNINIYTYKKGKWVLDNNNPLYSDLRAVIDEARKKEKTMAFQFPDNGYSTTRNYFYITVEYQQYFFDWKKSLKVLDDIEENFD